ncbi:MAG: MmgE/PrpD family protein [Pseudomonadota bacterium]
MSETSLMRLGRFVAEDPLELDGGLLGTIRTGVIDCFGCILAGARHPLSGQAAAAAEMLGLYGERPVYGTGSLVSKPAAALLNASAGHAVEFDDWEVPGNTHPSVVLLPALLAAADEGTEGRALAQAYLAGFEVIARLGEGLNFEHYDRGWHSTATLGTIGAAGAVSRLLGLTAEEATGALSLAISRSAGLTCQFGSAAKALQAGFAAEAGLSVAYLAKAGLFGQPHALDHDFGLRALMAGTAQERLDRAIEKLGTSYALAEQGLVLKPWPSCGYTHRLMTAALELASEVPDLADVERADLHLPDFHAKILPFRQPRIRAEALFSAPFVASMGLADACLRLSDLDDQAWRRPEIQCLIGKTHVHPFAPSRPHLNYDPQEPDRIVLTLTGGRQVEARCSYPLGAPQNPMSAAQIEAKFKDNAAHLAPHQADRVFNWISDGAVTDVFASAGVQP